MPPEVTDFHREVHTSIPMNRFRRVTLTWARLGFLWSSCWVVACTPHLANSHRSVEDLCIAVLDALQRDDKDALLALMVTKDEHENLLWDQLPSRKHLEFEYVRSLNERNSAKALENATTDAELDCEMLPDGMTVRVHDFLAYEPEVAPHPHEMMRL